jgi:hypothetical protein
LLKAATEEKGGHHGQQTEDHVMMGIRSSFFLLVFRRNAARQRRMQEAGEQGRSQNLPFQSQELLGDLDRQNCKTDPIETRAGPVLGRGAHQRD